jgi:GTP cyclohydrolase I
MNKERVQELIRELLIELGEDPEREGLERTPARVATAYEFLTSGYHVNPTELINEAVFAHEADQMIIARDLDFYSLCEHHMLPFFGRCHVGYIPSGKVIGVSKIARLVDMYARRLQIQERLTEQIAHAINEAIAWPCAASRRPTR